jgi:hypothetical protein
MATSRPKIKKLKPRHPGFVSSDCLSAIIIALTLIIKNLHQGSNSVFA